MLYPDGETESFDILAGVLQGDTLAPYLFVIALDYAMRIAIVNEEDLGLTLAKAKSRRYPATYISDTDFADDITLFSNTREQPQKLLQQVEAETKQIGLHINVSKTEYMFINQVEGDIVTNGDEKLKRFDDYLYLGAWIESSEKDIEVRIAKAWTALEKMNKIWLSVLQRNINIELFKATVETVLLYGSSTWTLIAALRKKL